MPSVMRHSDTGYRHENGGGDAHPSYSTDGEESHRAPCMRTVSEYAIAHEHGTSVLVKPVPPSRRSNNGPKYENVGEMKKFHGNRNCDGSDFSRDNSPSVGRSTMNRNNNNSSDINNGSEIYAGTGTAYRATSELSRGSRHSPAPSWRIAAERAASNYSGSGRSGRSGRSTVKSHTSRHGGLVVETMSTPNPFCPNTKGICCLMLLVNLGLILVTLGFVIVIQFFQPLVVWILGIVFLIFGFVTLIGSLVYCVHVFRNAKHPRDVNPEDLYWTRYWQGHVGSAPEIHYKAEGRYPDDAASDRFGKYPSNYSVERDGHRY